MPVLSIRLFGYPQVELNGRPVQFERKNALAILAIMAMENSVLPREKLANFFWADSLTKSARHNLNNNLSTLRRELGGQWFDANRATVRLVENDEVWVDVQAFLSLISSVRSHCISSAVTCDQCLALLEEVVHLYSADFLSSFSLRHAPEFEDWQRKVATTLQSELKMVLERLATELAKQRAFEGAQRYTRLLLTIDPYNESIYCYLAQIHMDAGQFSTARDLVNECIQLLRSEGLEPGQETVDFAVVLNSQNGVESQSIRDVPLAVNETFAESVLKTDLSLTHRRLSQADPALYQLGSSTTKTSNLRHNLPASITPMIGRERELIELQQLLKPKEIRLINIVGPGGMGKTRLALAIGEALITQAEYSTSVPNSKLEAKGESTFVDGIFFVSLAAMDESDQIPAAIADAIHYHLDTGELARAPKLQITDYLRRKHMLLILDNFEHLLDGRVFLVDILRNAPNVQILVTSRERLMLQDEQLYTLYGLELPDRDQVGTAIEAKSVELFVESARLIRPDFNIDHGEYPCLVQISHIAGGMPLALKLAASWIDVLPLHEIAAEMQHGMDFLETELRDMPTRHRSMRAMLSYSWRCLNPVEQKLMETLSVFRGGFDREAAEAVANASLRALSKLVSKSFLHVDNERNRYEIHELIRQFAAEKLASNTRIDDDVKERHGLYFMTWLAKLEPALKGHGQLNALAVLALELENARVAWKQCIDGLNIDAIEIGMETLLLFLEWRGRYQDGENLCTVALQRFESALPKRFIVTARLLTWQCRFSMAMGQTQGCLEKLEESLHLLETSSNAGGINVRIAMARALRQQASLVELTDGDTAFHLYEEALMIMDSIGEEWEAAQLMLAALRSSSNFHFVDIMNIWNERSLTISETLGDQRGIATALINKSQGMLQTWQFEKASHLLHRAALILQAVSDREGLVYCLATLAYTENLRGEFDQATKYIDEMMAIAVDLGNHEHLASAYLASSDLCLHLGRFKQCLDYSRNALELAHKTCNSGRMCYALDLIGEALYVLELMEEAEKVTKEGIDLSRRYGDPVWLVNHLTRRGRLMHHAGKPQIALKYLGEALHISIATGYLVFALNALIDTVFVITQSVDARRGIELYGLIEQYPIVIKSCFYQEICGKHVNMIAKTLPEDVVAMAKERGSQREFWVTIKELAAEFGPVELNQQEW